MGIELPKNWTYTTIESVGEVVTGNTPSMKIPEYYGGKIPWVKPPDINKSRTIFSTDEKLTEKGATKSRLLPKNSIMVTCIGNLGNIAIAGTELATNQQINSIVFDERIAYYKYGYYYCLTIKPWLVENSTSTTISMVNKSNFSKAPFILPPINEQKRIADKLETFFAHIDIIKDKLKNIPDHLKQFKESVLNQAVTGKLTEKWRTNKKFESPNELITRIINRRKKLYNEQCIDAQQKGLRKPTKVLLEELPKVDEIDVDLPNGWFQTNIHFLSFVTKLAGFEYTDHFKLKDEGDIPVVRAQNVQMGYFEDKNRLYLSKEKSDFLERSQLHGREILMVFIGAGTGNVCLAPKDERWHLAPNVAKIDVDGIDTEYLYYYLQSSLGLNNTLSRVKATAQPSLSMETIREIVALVPPVEEQKEIVKRIKEMFDIADKIEDNYKNLKEKIKSLPASTLNIAFKGELVPQDEKDEPAIKLLERIKKEKDEEIVNSKIKKNIRPKNNNDANLKLAVREYIKKNKDSLFNSVDLINEFKSQNVNESLINSILLNLIKEGVVKQEYDKKRKQFYFQLL
jgi:type I restriction enzyme S subunit